MGKNACRITKSAQLLQLAKALVDSSCSRRNQFSWHPTETVGRIRCPHVGKSKRTVGAPAEYGRLNISQQGATHALRPHICIYNVRVSHDATTLCSGRLDNDRPCDVERCTPFASMYIGAPSGLYFVKRRLHLRNDRLQFGHVTTFFLKLLFGPNVNKVVYNDAPDLSCYLRHNFNVCASNILDLSYMHIAQSRGCQTATSISMIQEMLDSKAAQMRAKQRLNRVPPQCPHRLAKLHCGWADVLLEHLLAKHGHSENSWKRRINETTQHLSSEPRKQFSIRKDSSTARLGEFTPSVFKGHLEETISRVLGKRKMMIRVADDEVFTALVKSKSYVERTALLTLNAFVAAGAHSAAKQLYAIVEPEAFNQLDDLEVGDTLQVVPKQIEKGIVCLHYYHDKVCCHATRLHGDALMYNVRTGKLVPRFTPHR
ncbi:hypothetical protein, conserved [Babesia bigemina]|uniref:Uncharacterized protein n=1 Tax=Babesia bigemina TaxID=5866 RepID=A0A061D7A4_BABBI|nr:hypothetical protein, conserved [Babesia bigemina]CDR96418.1 hypothetical protein, conserved [Babesia bigemina]|eukprot:XP_012768604.1 hypothetical protein, conserved [Babesia bigemina]